MEGVDREVEPRRMALWIRVGPFLIFLGLTFCQGKFGEGSRYWFYLAKTLAGAAMIWVMHPRVSEMRWAWSWEAVAAGVAVFGLWIGMDGWYPAIAVRPWNPLAFYGSHSILAGGFIGVRLVGSSLVVPPLEEVFYRSFVYRWVMRPDFQKVPLNQFQWKALLLTSVVFAMEHAQWLPGFFCGLIYQGLVLRKNRLGDALTAHALTNFLLGIWVVTRGAWHFW